jgi:hypothetical protein
MTLFPLSSFFDTSSPRGQNRLAWLIIILFIVFVSVVAQEKSLMADEAKHYKYEHPKWGFGSL